MKIITIYEANDGSRWETAEEAAGRDAEIRISCARQSRYDRLIARAIDRGPPTTPLRDRERDQVFLGARLYGLEWARNGRLEQFRAGRLSSAGQVHQKDMRS